MAGSRRALVHNATVSVTISSLLARIWALEQLPMLFVPAMMIIAWGIWS